MNFFNGNVSLSWKANVQVLWLRIDNNQNLIVNTCQHGHCNQRIQPSTALNLTCAHTNLNPLRRGTKQLTDNAPAVFQVMSSNAPVQRMSKSCMRLHTVYQRHSIGWVNLVRPTACNCHQLQQQPKTDQAHWYTKGVKHWEQARSQAGRHYYVE